MVRTDGAPVFVKIDEYKEILEVMNLIKNKIYEAKNTIKKINDVRSEEENEIDMWAGNLAEIERKVAFIDKTLFEVDKE